MQSDLNSPTHPIFPFLVHTDAPVTESIAPEGATPFRVFPLSRPLLAHPC